MQETNPKLDSEKLTLVDKHRFFIMIFLAICLAAMLVAVSMALYYSSGAAQLDLSRPGYKDIRSKVDSSDDFQNYPSTGPINQTAINQFEVIFDDQAKKIESVDSFGGDPLSPSALGIDPTASL
jgi:hypothetical protein